MHPDTYVFSITTCAYFRSPWTNERCKISAGVIGQSAPMFDIWGDTVNIASRMMTTGIVGKIQVRRSQDDQL